jgi:auxin efflux carrier family protein
MGPELTPSNLSQLWIVPVWGFLSTAVAHAMGWIGVKLFKVCVAKMILSR